MKSNSLHLTVLFTLLFSGIVLLFSSCDKVRKEEAPEPKKVAKYTTRSGMPVVMNIIKQHNFSGQASFVLKGTLVHGTAEFIQNGMLLYTPNNTTNNVVETISYDACSNGACNNYTFDVQVNSSSSPVDSSIFCTQGFALPTIAVLNYPAELFVNIPISANGFICNNQSVLGVSVQPSQGTTEVITAGVTAPYIKYTYDPSSGQGQSNTDHFVYTLSDPSNVNNMLFGIVTVTINQVGSCALVVQNDSYQVASASQGTFLNVLANDQFCINSLALGTTDAFKIVVAPVNGSILNITNFTGVSYKANTGYIGLDSLKYQLKYANGTIKIGKVLINVGTNPCITAVDAMEDVYEFPISQIQNGIINLPVLANDTYCPTQVIVEILEPIGNLQLSVNPDKTIKVVLPSPTFTGALTFNYKITSGGAAVDTASVTVNVSN